MSNNHVPNKLGTNNAFPSPQFPYGSLGYSSSGGGYDSPNLFSSANLGTSDIYPRQLSPYAAVAPMPQQQQHRVLSDNSLPGMLKSMNETKIKSVVSNLMNAEKSEKELKTNLAGGSFFSNPATDRYRNPPPSKMQQASSGYQNLYTGSGGPSRSPSGANLSRSVNGPGQTLNTNSLSTSTESLKTSPLIVNGVLPSPSSAAFASQANAAMSNFGAGQYGSYMNDWTSPQLTNATLSPEDNKGYLDPHGAMATNQFYQQMGSGGGGGGVPSPNLYTSAGYTPFMGNATLEQYQPTAQQQQQQQQQLTHQFYFMQQQQQQAAAQQQQQQINKVAPAAAYRPTSVAVTSIPSIEILKRSGDPLKRSGASSHARRGPGKRGRNGASADDDSEEFDHEMESEADAHIKRASSAAARRRARGSRSTGPDVTTPAINSATVPEPRVTSKHRGVCWYKRTKKWVVQTKVNGKRLHVGYFEDEEQAAEAYRKAVAKIKGEMPDASMTSDEEEAAAAVEASPAQQLERINAGATLPLAEPEVAAVVPEVAPAAVLE